MKVVHISTRDRGGAANGCIGLHKGLLQSGVDSTMLVLEKTRNDIEDCYPFYHSPVARFLGKARHKLWGSREFCIRRLPRGYEAFHFPFSSHRPENSPLVQKADIVHLHWIAGFVNYPSFFRKVQKPLFWTLHDMNPFSGGCHFVEGFPVRAYSQFDKSNSRLKQRVLQGKDLTVVSPSTWLSGVSSRSDAFGQFPHHVVPYGIDVDTFRLRDRHALRDKLGIKSDAKVILFVADGIKNKRKGFEHLLTALGEHALQNQFTLVVAGKKSDDFTLPQSSIELGHVTDREQMACVYGAADFFVTPAIEDNLPNTVLESLCCGTPVIAFNIGGMPDMIEHEKNGILCDEVDGRSLAASIQMAHGIDFDRAGISQAARSRYSPGNQAQAYLDMYKQSVLAHGRS